MKLKFKASNRLFGRARSFSQFPDSSCRGSAHNCLEHFDDMVAGTLEWLADPAAVVRAYRLRSAREAREAAIAAAIDDPAGPGDELGELVPEAG